MHSRLTVAPYRAADKLAVTLVAHFKQGVGHKIFVWAAANRAAIEG